ncbi:unnamed protein product [Trichogramma brassicae]|uniref:C2H2-type domain-containing protein n=1 Tax=Trichogramma brassicae TaxID=86971 RepID=A0A6H5IWS4_9HYME|nr:unnamed protein product [Trichogramma brassicae]
MPPKRRSDKDHQLQQQQQQQQQPPQSQQQEVGVATTTAAASSAGSSSTNGNNNQRHINPAVAKAFADHELFLQAFEKPTQIYRYLRTRNQVSPIFLHRNLSYMMDWRMKRSNRTRRNFRVNSILDRQLAKIDKNVAGNGRMTISFAGVFHPSLSDTQDPVTVETYLVKICHKKRKDVSTPIMQVSVGSAKIPVNPTTQATNNVGGGATTTSSSSPTIHVPKESFSLGGTSKTYMLLMTVQFPGSSSPTMNGDSDDEPAAKRCKLSNGTASGKEPETRIYSSELTVYDKHNKCQLTEGEYALSLTEIQGAVRGSPKKHMSWESLTQEAKRDCPPIDDFEQQLLLKFKLSWTRELNNAQNGFVDRSMNNGALLLQSATTAGDNKENRPGNNGLIHNNNTSTNNANNSSLNSSSLLGTPKVTLANGELTEASKRHQIVYQFLYNNNSRQQTEACEDFQCPWCSLECGKLYSLLKHLKLCHSRFIFTYAPIPQGARIDVAINHYYDGSYSGSPHTLIQQPSTSKNAKTGPARRTSVSNILVCRPKRPKPSLSEFLEPDENELESSRPYITGHNRLYHHTVTCLPIYPKELDVDSEGENDPKWLQTKTMMMIDDFTDVNEGEKELMKMWNLHVMKHGYVGDCQIPLACQMFVEQRGKELLMKNLYRNFILHMSNLFDFSLISPPVLFQTIQKLQDIMQAEGANSEARKVLQKAHADQVEWWSANGSQNFSEPVKTANSVQASKVHFNNQDTHRRKTTTLPMSSPPGNAHLHAKHPSMMSSGTNALGNLHSPKDAAAPVAASVNGIDAASSQQIRRKSAAIDHQQDGSGGGSGNNAKASTTTSTTTTGMQRRKSSVGGNENEYHRRKLVLDPVPNGTTATKTVQNGSF